ncbi:hypothetical protein BSR29_08260 [Boudabousia liubingyangii]|uniref:DUF3043 domain-containing protein n=1 Tax=Boudabousia liubingyangii TaxID=1921764 RepID=A0A1Q5PJA2_9ACTO|nr:DUF3043 domain-containing protein [Boudabousia liubingyangii]OKL45965.1 hypothetical protein BSR29_08260 [Boudabousia liubingyangii]OKL47759.1 hypothetical protein BSR28_04570 [Boudabousia liubingyangii]
MHANDKVNNSESENPNGPKRKGRPTPKRKEAEAARRRDLVPADRKAEKQRIKELKQAERKRRDELFRRQQEAMRTGDERYMPLRDRGPARRFMRDYIDSRFTISEWMLPVAFIAIILMFVFSQNPVWQVYSLAGVYSFFFLAFFESIIMAWHCKRQIRTLHPQWEIPRWSGMYMFMRLIQLRALRNPRPQVARGERPGK